MFDFDCQMRFWKSATDAAFGYASATLAAVAVMQDRVQDQMAGGDSQGATASAAAPFSFDAFNPFGPFAAFVLPFQWWGLQQPGNPFTPFATGARTGTMSGTMTGTMPDFFSAFFPWAPPVSPAAQEWNPFSFAGMPAHSFLDPSSFLANTPFSGQLFDSSWSSPWSSPWSSQWVEMMRSFGWVVPQPSWTMWQHPMTAALMAAGMPYSVASPTARANASAMDAADAAREGFNKAFSSYHSDGGHAASHIAPKPADEPVDIMSMMMAPWMAFAAHPPPG